MSINWPLPFCSADKKGLMWRLANAVSKTCVMQCAVYVCVHVDSSGLKSMFDIAMGCFSCESAKSFACQVAWLIKLFSSQSKVKRGAGKHSFLLTKRLVATTMFSSLDTVMKWGVGDNGDKPITIVVCKLCLGFPQMAWFWEGMHCVFWQPSFLFPVCVFHFNYLQNIRALKYDLLACIWVGIGD